MQLFESNVTDETVHGAYIFGSNYRGQTFTPSVSHRISRISIHLKKYGSPSGTILLFFFATSGGLPTGTNITWTTKAADTITGEGWYDFDIDSSYVFVAGTKYAFYLVYTIDDSNNAPIMIWEEHNPTYSGGNDIGTNNEGVSWWVGSNDFHFKEYGISNGLFFCMG
jgi:hypothetical protein